MNASQRIRELETEQTPDRLSTGEIAPHVDEALVGDHEPTLTPEAVDKLLSGEEDGRRAIVGFAVAVTIGALVWIVSGLVMWHALRR
jgi:hypothetical protein